jgi:hypothetical protein
LVILNSIYVACGEFGIITKLWGVKSNQGGGWSLRWLKWSLMALKSLFFCFGIEFD